MAFRHGVYTSEIETSLQTAPAVDSALPFVVGASPNTFGPVIVSSWRQFVELSGISEGTDDIAGDDGWHKHSLTSFAYLWFRLCGRSDCILRGIASADGSLSQNAVIAALDDIDTVYERTRRLPSLILVPYFGTTEAIWTAAKAKAALYGGRFKAVAIGDIQSSEHAFSGVTPNIISSPSDAVTAKTISSESLALLWPYIGIGNLRFDLSSVAVAVMNRVDAQNGDLPFVSPSNKNCYATGVYVLKGSGGSDGGEGYEEAPLFQSRDEINATLGANGLIGALNTADGWVLWGNSTTAFPGSTDVKDYLLASRRMFNYTQNAFQLFSQPRIDNPLNRRQLEGVVNSFNQILASLQGFGALNAASVSIDDERNTTEQLIRGVVYFRIRIAPPPPMQEINGVFEFDVQGFEASLA